MAEATAAPRVDFYVVPASGALERLRVACRIAEKAYRGALRVVVVAPDEQERRSLDDLLWTFADGSFVPHERSDGAQDTSEVPVVLTGGAEPPGRIDVIINLGDAVPAFFERSARIAEIIDGDERRRSAGRARFRIYRERGLEPATHNLRAD
jgi:DNA polymerase III subunit chi